MSDNECCIYVIAKKLDDGKWSSPVKVGISKSPRKRLATIKTATPFPVDLIVYACIPTREIAVAIERCFHEVMEKTYTRHGEWFDMEPTQAAGNLFLAIGASINANSLLTSDEINDYLEMAFHSHPEVSSLGRPL